MLFYVAMVESFEALLSQFPRSSEVANGKVCFRFLVDMQMALDPCPAHFKSRDGWTCPGEVANIYHCTDLRVLTQPGPFCTGSGGILNDKAIYASSNGHSGRFGVFGHGSIQQAYMCLSREATACFLELEAKLCWLFNLACEIGGSRQAGHMLQIGTAA